MGTALVIAAHPDDEVLGCGGTIRRLSNEGWDVHVAILGEGATSRYSERQMADLGVVAELAAQAQDAAAILGASSIELMGLPDNRFDTLPLLEVIKAVESLIERKQPSFVYTHHLGDLNVDHQITARATLTATRPMAGTAVDAVFAFEIPSSTEWAFGLLAPAFSPNYFVNIATTLEAKIAAMETYAHEVRPYPHPRSTQGLRAIAERWGTAVGYEAAEAFALLRMRS